jgi:TPR repeat protein
VKGSLPPELVERRLCEVGALHALGRSLLTARRIDRSPAAQAEEVAYQAAVAGFSAAQGVLNVDSWLPPIVRAAGRGVAEAQCIVGNCFQLGLGYPADLSQAGEWYLRAATQGYAVAFVNLGTLCALQGDRAGAEAWHAEARALGF